MVNLFDQDSVLVGTFDTIQEAVDAAGDGHTIIVSAGTYVEQVVVNGIDDLTIQAAEGEAVTVQAPIGGLVQTATGPGPQAIYAIVTAENCMNFTLQGVDVDGAGQGNHAWSPAGAAFDGVYFRNSSGSVIDVDIVGIRDPYQPGGMTADGNPVVDGVQHGYGVEVRNDTILPFTMTGGSISDFQKNAGFFVRTDLDISGVTVTGGGAQLVIAQNGFSIFYSTGTVSGNLITGIGYAGPAEAYSGGINARSNIDLDIIGNIVIGSNNESLDAKVVGIWVDQIPGRPISGGEVSGNTVFFTDVGINASGSFSPDAIVIRDNSISNLDLTDIYTFGVNFQPTASLLIPFDVEGSQAADLLVGASGDDILSGLAGTDQLRGGEGDDRLDGGSGSDLMTGGNGNDIYIVGEAGDQVVESSETGGVDEVRSSISYTLGTFVENLRLMGSNAINATGNGLDNVLRGNVGNNILDGGAGADTMTGEEGNDTYIVDNAGDTVTELVDGGLDIVLSSVSYQLSLYTERLTLTGTGNINATGSALAEVLTGNSGNNVLDGRFGADTMTGGAGDDTYIVNNAGDMVTELLDEGTDTVMSSVGYTLGAHLENLTLTGTGSVSGTGNDLANVITGNQGANRLDGGAGADTLIGGRGNDVYVIDAGDIVVEAAGGGIDTVESALGYTLGAHLENLTLTGSASVNGMGNSVANVLTGNSGNNVLDGGFGADTMAGGAGDDTYVVNEAGDVVTELANQGTDTVRSSVTYTLGANLENLKLAGTGSFSGTGNALDNVITGNAGANALNGRGGNDTLSGGNGADGFYFDTALGAGNVDTIIDFSPAADTIFLDSAIFDAIGDGVLHADAFHKGATAQDAEDRIVYDAATGNLFYDADGSGAGEAILFATINRGYNVTHLDFNVYTGP